MTTQVLRTPRFSAGIGRHKSAPWGLNGGHPALSNQLRYSFSGQPVVPPTGKVDATMPSPVVGRRCGLTDAPTSS